MMQDYDGVPVLERDQVGLPLVTWETVLRDQHHLGPNSTGTKAYHEEMAMAVALSDRPNWWLKWADGEGFWTHKPSERWLSYGGGIRAKNAKRFLLFERTEDHEQDPRAFVTLMEAIEAAEA